MAYGELYIEIERPKRNALNGRFLKGHIPNNKGKKWDEWMGKRKQRKVRSVTRKCFLGHQKKERPDVSERCRKALIGIDDNGKWLYFPYGKAAADFVGGCSRNVRRCALSNLSRSKNKKTGKINTDHKYMGVRFYFETDSIWCSKIKE